MRLWAIATCVVAIVSLLGAVRLHAATVGSLQHKISAGQGRVSSLSGSVKSASNHLAALGSSIAKLQRQLGPIQARLNASRLELLKIRSEAYAARARLAQLEAAQTHSEQVLASQLVGTYESPPPDIITVVLEAHGFQSLLDQINFTLRVQRQDARVVAAVRAARAAVAAQATRLGALEVRQQALATQILRERDSLARDKLSLLEQRSSAARARGSQFAALQAARSQVSGLERSLAKLEAAQSGFSGGSVSGGAVMSGGGFTFPMPRGAASPPGTWSLDQGVDISAPGGTPLLAVGSGTIVLHGIGGFGPWAPVLHLDSGQYIYYGHAGPAGELPVGSHVGAGQVIGEVGPGIVGISTGPHLEIGFADSSGSPIGGGTASTMMSLLRGAYGG